MTEIDLSPLPSTYFITIITINAITSARAHHLMALQRLIRNPPSDRLGSLHRPSDLPREIEINARARRILMRTPLWRLPPDYMCEYVDNINRYACVVELLRMKQETFEERRCDVDFADYVLDKALLRGRMEEHGRLMAVWFDENIQQALAAGDDDVL